MAVQTVRVASFGGGTAWVSFDYDDVALQVVALAAQNDSTLTLYLNVTSPRVIEQTVGPGGSLSVALPPGQRIDYTDGLNWHGTGLIHKGIEWSAVLGV